MTPAPVPIDWRDTVDSTNDEVRRRLAEGHASPVCVAARAQRSGRGTRGRPWSSPADAGVYLSLGLRPEPAPPATALYTPAAGVAAVEAIFRACNLRVALKPVNDLVAEGRKLGGILTEGELQDGRLVTVVVGVGINVVPAAIDTPDARPISLAELAPDDPPPPIERVATLLVERLIWWCDRASAADDELIRRTWLAHAIDGAAFPTP